MAYTVLARRYRSQSFDQVVGQEPIARTLRNAIATGRVAHAYLFTGTRGVGKTSLARLFARALNAPDSMDGAPRPPDGEDELPPADVQQRMADAIMSGEDLNVIEIDGASNRGVDDARDLIAKAGLSPTSHARYKVYIIDEVHMLTREAFNALLKTMEEPPGHVKFILCTTEPHKVPATIQSRCQRFDFRNIPTGQIAAHLGDVLKQEEIDADEQVVWQVARLGNGSMRDALSLLDRLIATGESPLTMKTLEEMFGLPDAQLVNDFVDAIASGGIPDALARAADLLGRGISQDQLVEVLIERFRHLMLLAACGPDTELVELSDEAKQQAHEQSQKFDAAALTYMIALCENLQRSSKSSANPRALFDATVVRLALAEKMADVSALLSGDAPKPHKKKVTSAGPRPVKPPPSAPGSAGGSPSSPKPQITLTDPQQVWSALRRRLTDRPGLAWANHLQLVRLDERAAVVAPTPGHREVAGFATPQRLDQIAVELQPILGRRVRITLESAVPSAAGGQAVNDDETHPAVDPAPDARREALDLPLVRRAFETFPDATLISVQAEDDESQMNTDKHG